MRIRRRPARGYRPPQPHVEEIRRERFLSWAGTSLGRPTERGIDACLTLTGTQSALRPATRRHDDAAAIALQLCDPHGLRHFCATRQAAGGTPIRRIVAAAVRYDIRTTSVYLDDVSSEHADDREHVPALGIKSFPWIPGK